MSKKLLIFLVIVLGVCGIGYILLATGVIKLETATEDVPEKKTIISVEDLEDSHYYVWHNEKTNDIADDLKGTVDADVFKVCPVGDINWGKDEITAHTIWFTSSNDKDIPTVYPGDKILYISSTYVPVEGISWERFSDYGYTIGVANMVGDASGHYRIINSGDKKLYKGYVYPNSDANVLNQFQNVSNLFLDKIGSVKVRDNFISESGTVKGLEKNKKYICEWYTGTYYQDFEMKANVHTFGSLESFMTYDYEFLHSNCISITIPNWLKTGYYYLDEIGLFRYVSTSDAKLYNGEPYDASIDWNDPIILYNEDGTVKYDPSRPSLDTEKESRTDNEKKVSEVDTNQSGNASQEVQGQQTTEDQFVNDNFNQNADDGDVGAEEYEDIYNEIVYE